MLFLSFGVCIILCFGGKMSVKRNKKIFLENLKLTFFYFAHQRCIYSFMKNIVIL